VLALGACTDYEEAPKSHHQSGHSQPAHSQSGHHQSEHHQSNKKHANTPTYKQTYGGDPGTANMTKCSDGKLREDCSYAPKGY